MSSRATHTCRIGVVTTHTAHRGAVADASCRHLDAAQDPLVPRPGDEPSRVLARRWASGEPGVDIVLRSRLEDTAAIAEPDEELDGDGGRLLGVEECARGHWPGPRVASELVQQVPADEAIDELVMLGIVDLRELHGEPAALAGPQRLIRRAAHPRRRRHTSLEDSMNPH